jgi:hypothetical protein
MLSRVLAILAACAAVLVFHSQSSTAAGSPIQTTCSGIAVVRSGQWSLQDNPGSFPFGNPVFDIPVIGNWAYDGSFGNGLGDIGIFRNGVWFLTRPGQSQPDVSLVFGDPGDKPITGDWPNQGFDGVGVVRNGVWYLRNANSGGPADAAFFYGDPGDIPVAGDWDGDGTDTPGVVRNGVWYLRNSNTTGVADIVFSYGNPGATPVVGDWKVFGFIDFVDTPGVFQNGIWSLRNSNSSGPPDAVVSFGAAGDLAVAPKEHCRPPERTTSTTNPSTFTGSPCFEAKLDGEARCDN